MKANDVMAPRAQPPAEREAACTIAYRRSLRASRTRRAAGALRRRRVLRSRASMLLASAGLALAGGGALAAGGEPKRAVSAGGTIVAAQRALGVAADGVVGPRTRAATRRFQRRRGLAVDGVIGPQTLKALGIRVRAAARRAVPAGGASGTNPLLARIAACESGGNPGAVSADGTYRGKYQFSRETWAALGGSGDPARASEAEQDRLAARLLQQSGTSPWPNCG